jgi:hypothetical protein
MNYKSILYVYIKKHMNGKILRCLNLLVGFSSWRIKKHFVNRAQKICYFKDTQPNQVTNHLGHTFVLIILSFLALKATNMEATVCRHLDWAAFSTQPPRTSASSRGTSSNRLSSTQRRITATTLSPSSSTRCKFKGIFNHTVFCKL